MLGPESAQESFETGSVPCAIEILAMGQAKAKSKASLGNQSLGSSGCPRIHFQPIEALLGSYGFVEDMSLGP